VNFIRDAIEGFLMQKTTFPVEILIHDDASTDGTADIIREYEAKYPRLIRPIYQAENQCSRMLRKKNRDQ
jgi:glycosyltransferase involved in cell wall biosynthesis